MLRLFDRFRSAPASWAIARPLQGPVELSDLLGRPAINLDTPELQRFLAGKRVLVTGAGGSIGSEICRQTMRFCPDRLILLERAENALFEIDRELRHHWVGSDIRPAIGDVCDVARVQQVLQAERPHVVFHCAAHKHVPMMEAHPCEAIKNNILGTKTLADACREGGVAAFVLVSTDKAVNPTSVMGATKRFAELYVQSLNEETGRWGDGETGRQEQSSQTSAADSFSPSPRLRVTPSGFARSTRFLAVRFGNVLGSSGSVVPIFQKQIEAGGPVTITHAEMTRYFMTIPEASQLVMQAGAIGQGGEIFVLDMGAQVRIVDLAMELIRRNGLRPHEDIAIRFTGIRPGEKLYEELAGDDEQTCPTAHEKIRVWKLPTADGEEVARGIAQLSNAAATGSSRAAVAALAECVPEYQSAANRVAITAEPARIGPSLRLVPSKVEAA